MESYRFATTRGGSRDSLREKNESKNSELYARYEVLLPKGERKDYVLRGKDEERIIFAEKIA